MPLPSPNFLQAASRLAIEFGTPEPLDLKSALL